MKRPGDWILALALIALIAGFALHMMGCEPMVAGDEGDTTNIVMPTNAAATGPMVVVVTNGPSINVNAGDGANINIGDNNSIRPTPPAPTVEPEPVPEE